MGSTFMKEHHSSPSGWVYGSSKWKDYYVIIKAIFFLLFFPSNSTILNNLLENIYFWHFHLQLLLFFWISISPSFCTCQHTPENSPSICLFISAVLQRTTNVLESFNGRVNKFTKTKVGSVQYFSFLVDK